MTSLTYPCGFCRKNVGEKVKCIECSICSKYYHYKCSNLDIPTLKNHVVDPTLTWRSSRCIVYRCKKCVKVIGKNQTKYFCVCCKEWYHQRCTGNTQCTGNNISMCVSFKSENIPFFNISDTKLSSCISQCIQLVTVETDDCTMYCAVCQRRNKNIQSGVKCNICKCLTHLKCTEMNTYKTKTRF